MQGRERILIVGGDDAKRAGYLDELRAAGYSVDARGGVIEDAEGADLVLVAGGAEGSRRDGFGAVMDAITAARKAAGPAAIVACVPRDNADDAAADVIGASLASGADDVVVCPPRPGALLARIGAGLKMAAARVALERFERYGDALAHIGGSVGLTLETSEALSDILGRIAEAVGWTRAALLLCTDEVSSVLLVSASDDQTSMKVPIKLERYPEVRAAFESREPVLVEDAKSSALLGPWAEIAAEKGGRALLAVPLLVERKVAGALLVRNYLARPPLGPRAIDFLRVAASMLGLVLKSGRVFEGLREQTRRMPLQRYNEERRTRALEQYKDFFEASTDGMAVLDANAAILYVNRAAEQMTGFAREGLNGRDFTELVSPGQRESLANIIKQVVAGANLEVFDVALSTTSGEQLTVSVSSSPVLAEHGGAVLAFRDVTEARALEGELRKTSDFLERLIDSTVDGIICADMRGNILIFNQGAARLYGYSPGEVVGKLPVWKLYPDGVARAIMSELRSADHGGVGRMEPTRREIVTKDGELVPVSLAASIVYEDGREIATVGIVSDLRDRLKIEQRLAQAQEKLVVTEKQALIAELAGTTAHELNQPLTSVMGYSELLKKKMSPDDVHYRAVDIILREAERMAEIVRKIGKITRYETKAYVGSTQILDLDKSTTDG
ncbi:MAG TPA: PAS domain S-box protein [Polyangia bacterium]|nr:PAS domain S-box protein [Polyangia bacterium]